RVAAVDPQSGATLPWNPNANGTVRAITADGNAAYVAGAFTSIKGTPSGNLASLSLENSIPCPAITLPAPPLPAGVVGTPYVLSAAATGGTSPYCYSVSAGALPAGFLLNSTTGQISGTPSTAGISVFSITATDARGCKGTAG